MLSKTPNEFTAAIGGMIIMLSQEIPYFLMPSGFSHSVIIFLIFGIFGWLIPAAFLIVGIDAIKGRGIPWTREGFRLCSRLLASGGGYLVTSISIDAIKSSFYQ